MADAPTIAPQTTQMPQSHGAGGSWSTGDEYDPSAVYAYSSRGFGTDEANGTAFATAVYQDRFGFPAGSSLKDMTRAVHGHELDYTAANNYISQWYKPVGESGEESPLKTQILDGEKSLPRDIVTNIRFASATSNHGLLAATMRAHPELLDKIQSLATAYGQAYDHPLFNTADPGAVNNLMGNSVESVRGAVEGIVQRLGQIGEKTEEFVNPEPQYEKGYRAQWISESKAHAAITALPAGHNAAYNLVQESLRIAPDIGVMALIPEAAPAWGVGMVNDLHNQLLDKGLTTGQANTLAMVAAVPYVMGSALVTKFAGLLPSAARDAYSGAFNSTWKAGAAKFLTEYAKGTAQTGAGLELMQLADTSAKSAADAIQGKYGEIPNEFASQGKDFIHTMLLAGVLHGPQAVIGAVSAPTSSGQEAGSRPAGAVPKAGDPAMVVTAQHDEAKIGLDPGRSVGDNRTPEQIQALNHEVVKRHNQIVSDAIITQREEENALRQQSTAGALPQPEQPGESKSGEGVRQGEQGTAQPTGAREGEKLGSAQPEGNAGAGAHGETPRAAQNEIHPAAAQVPNGGEVRAGEQRLGDVDWSKIPDKKLIEGATWETKPELQKSHPNESAIAAKLGIRFDGPWTDTGLMQYTDPKTGSTFYAKEGSDAAGVAAKLAENRGPFADEYKAQENAPSTATEAPKAQKTAPNETPAQKARDRDISVKMMEHTKANGGGTYDVSGNPLTLKGFSVGVHQGNFRTLDVGDVEGLAKARQDIQNQYPGAQVGTEVVNGKINVDPSMNFSTREEALRKAAEMGQERIWNWDTFTSEEVPTKKESPAQKAQRVIREKTAQLKEDLKSGRIDAEIRARLKGEHAAFDYGAPLTPEGETPRPIERSVRMAFGLGREYGEANASPLENTVRNAYEDKLSDRRILTRADRQAEATADLAKIKTAEALLAYRTPKSGEMDTPQLQEARARAVKNLAADMGLSERARKNIAGTLHERGVHEAAATVAAIRGVVEKNLKATWAEQIIKQILSMKSGVSPLSPGATEQLKALRESTYPGIDAEARAAGINAPGGELEGRYDYHVGQVESIVKAQADLANAKRMQEAGHDVDIEAMEKRISGMKSGILAFLKNQPIDRLQKLSDDVAQIYATDRAERAQNAEAKKFGHDTARGAVVAEINGSPTKSMKGVVTHLRANESAQTIAEALGGGQNTFTTKKLVTDPRNAESDMRRDIVGKQMQRAAKAKELGISQHDLDVNWMKRDKTISFGGTDLKLSIWQLLRLRATVQDPVSAAQMARGAKIADKANWGRPSLHAALDAEDVKGQIESAVDAVTTPAEREYYKFGLDQMHSKIWLDKLNETFRYKTGADGATNPYYVPTERDYSESKTLSLDDTLHAMEGDRQRTLASGSGTKARTDNVHPFLLANGDMFEQHFEDMGRFAYLYKPITEAKALLDPRLSPDVHAAIIDRHGSWAMNHLNDTYDRAANVQQRSQWLGSRILAAWERNYTVARLWMNLPALVKTQALGSIMASNELSQKFGAKGVADFGRHMGETLTSVAHESAEYKADLATLLDPENGAGNLMYRWSPQAASAVMGERFRPGQVEGQKPRIFDKYEKLADVTSEIKYAKGGVSNWGMGHWVDVEQRIGVAAYRTALDGGATTAEAVKTAEETIQAVKPTSSAFDETRAYRFLRPIWALAPFMSATSRNAGLLRRDITRVTNAPEDGKAAAVKNLVGTSAALLTQAAVYGIMGRAGYSIMTGKSFIPQKKDSTDSAAFRTANHALDVVMPGAGRAVDALAHHGATVPMLDDVQHGYESAQLLAHAAQTGHFDVSHGTQLKALVQLVNSVADATGAPLPGPITDAQLMLGRPGKGK